MPRIEADDEMPTQPELSSIQFKYRHWNMGSIIDDGLLKSWVKELKRLHLQPTSSRMEETTVKCLHQRAKKSWCIFWRVCYIKQEKPRKKNSVLTTLTHHSGVGRIPAHRGFVDDPRFRKRFWNSIELHQQHLIGFQLRGPSNILMKRLKRRMHGNRGEYNGCNDRRQNSHP